MSLPPAFQTAEDYFEAASQFFRRYQFLCTSPNTDVLVNNVFDAIDLGGVEDDDVCEDGLSRLATRNQFLNEFYRSAREITVSYEEHVRDEELESIGMATAPLGPKKKHEVVYLAREIQRCCARAGCDAVVDFGSGLGYLDQRLHESTSYNVLGLECNEKHYVSAKQRQRRYHSGSLDRVKYVRCTVGAGSQGAVQGLLQDKFGKQPYCITGLHSCADLTTDALNIFLKSEDARALVLMPCCYHKMREIAGRFPNFPLSTSMRSVFDRLLGWEVMGGAFLRLGAQPPRADQRLPHRVFTLLARAALQLYAHAHNCKIKRNKRKAVKTKDMEQNFESYIQSAVHGFSLIDGAPAPAGAVCADFRQFDLRELRHIWQRISNSTLLKKAGIFVLLQQAVQEVAENLILFDRLMFLRERGVDKCAYRKIFDEKISPRALALVAFK